MPPRTSRRRARSCSRASCSRRAAPRGHRLFDGRQIGAAGGRPGGRTARPESRRQLLRRDAPFRAMSVGRLGHQQVLVRRGRQIVKPPLGVEPRARRAGSRRYRGPAPDPGPRDRPRLGAPHPRSAPHRRPRRWTGRASRRCPTRPWRAPATRPATRIAQASAASGGVAPPSDRGRDWGSTRPRKAITVPLTAASSTARGR